jgi:hypothetical protein
MLYKVQNNRGCCSIVSYESKQASNDVVIRGC